MLDPDRLPTDPPLDPRADATLSVATDDLLTTPYPAAEPVTVTVSLVPRSLDVGVCSLSVAPGTGIAAENHW